MDTEQYLEIISKFGDSNDDNKWEVLATNKGNSLFLMKDGNNLCYVTSGDLAISMPYHLAIAERTLVHYAGDSMIPEVAKAVDNGKMNPSKLVGIILTDADMKWITSEGIKGIVHSVESDN